MATNHTNEASCSQSIGASRRYVVTIEVTVIDEPALLKAAVANAVEAGTGETEESARERLAESLADCVQQLFDPGVSPTGTEIENCDVSVSP